MMKIQIPCVVSLTWRLEDAHGQLIDELDAPVEFFVGGDDLLAKVEEAIVGQSPGFEASLSLDPEHAFGDYVPDLVFFEERSLFPEDIAPGMQFDGPPVGAKTAGLSNDEVYTVTEVYPSHVVLDGNHPLAGIALRLDLTVTGVRAATEAEIEAGSVTTGPAVTVIDTPPPPSQLH